MVKMPYENLPTFVEDLLYVDPDPYIDHFINRTSLHCPVILYHLQLQLFSQSSVSLPPPFCLVTI